VRLGDLASRFLIGLVTCFATHGGIPAVALVAAAGLLVTCEIVPRRAGLLLSRRVVKRAKLA
jgi:hypothetical protein